MTQAHRDRPSPKASGGRDGGRSETGNGKKPANIAPDAVKDPNEKTDGKPGQPRQGGETDPGAG